MVTPSGCRPWAEAGPVPAYRVRISTHQRVLCYERPDSMTMFRSNPFPDQGTVLASPGVSLLWSDTRARWQLNSNWEGPLQTAHGMALMWVNSMRSGVCPVVVLLLWPFGWLTRYLWVLVSAAVEYNRADSFGPVKKESAWHAVGTPQLWVSWGIGVIRASLILSNLWAPWG